MNRRTFLARAAGTVAAAVAGVPLLGKGKAPALPTMGAVEMPPFTVTEAELVGDDVEVYAWELRNDAGDVIAAGHRRWGESILGVHRGYLEARSAPPLCTGARPARH